MAKLMVQDKRLELLRQRQRDLNPPCLPIPPILHMRVALRSANHHLTNYFVITGVLSIGKPLACNLAPVMFVGRAPVVRVVRLELTRPDGHKHLKLACLPIPAYPHKTRNSYSTIRIIELPRRGRHHFLIVAHFTSGFM